jgi:hypothetical protein
LQIFSGISRIPFDREQLEYQNNMLFNLHTELKLRADDLTKITDERRSIEYQRNTLSYKQNDFNREFLEVNLKCLLAPFKLLVGVLLCWKKKLHFSSSPWALPIHRKIR